jgi:RNase P subunit RPR2
VKHAVLALLIFCFAALKNRTERLGRDHLTTAKASRSMGIVKYMLKSFAEARIYLSDFVRVMDTEHNVDEIDYVIALGLLGEVHNAEGRGDAAKKLWTKAKSALDKNPTVSEKIPELRELISHRLEMVLQHLKRRSHCFQCSRRWLAWKTSTYRQRCPSNKG